MKQESKKIYEFKRGDKITRIKPSKSIMKLGDEEMVDRSHIGIPYIFVGIANGCIYLKRIISEQQREIAEFLGIFKNFSPNSDTIHLESELYEDGWANYIDPNIFENEEVNITDTYSINELEKLKENALKSEDYIEADRIQKLINKKK